MQKVYQVLFLCSGNSGRSIMGEAILGQLGGERFQAYSAGIHPTGRVNALTFDELVRRGYRTEGLSSKSWNQFVRPDAPELDHVIFVCERTAAERAPLWRGSPAVLCWPLPAPGQVTGSDQTIRDAFDSVCQQVEDHVRHFVRETLSREDEGQVEALVG